MSTSVTPTQTANPHLSSLQSLFEGKQTSLDWLVIAHNDPVMNSRLSNFLCEQTAMMLKVPQGSWQLCDESLPEAIQWSIDEANVKHILLVGHSQADLSPPEAAWVGGDDSSNKESTDSACYERLASGARGTQNRIKQAEHHFAAEVDSLLKYASLDEALSAGQVQLHGLFYLADSGTFMIYDICNRSFEPIV